MMDATAKNNKGALTGWHIGLVFCAFFAVVFGMNGVFLAAALRTNSGVVAVEPYRKGLDYNRRIEADALQRALGWHAEANFDGARLTVAIKADNAASIGGLTVEATVGRPATMAENISIKLIESSPGRYVAETPLTGSGAFIADVVARDGSGDIFRIRRRLWLAP
ncbi:MAG: FixH family protein [Hyphomicrobium sp.]